jgi:hypothetical protein
LQTAAGALLFCWKNKEGQDQRLTADGVNAAPRQRFAHGPCANGPPTFCASSIVASALQEGPKARLKQGYARLKQSSEESAKLLANACCPVPEERYRPSRSSCAHGRTRDPALLFMGPQRVGLTREETSTLRLLKQKAGK